MRTIPVANTLNFPNQGLGLVLTNLLVCIAVMAWTELRDVAGGPQNYFNAMVYFGITAYSMLEARWSSKARDLRNSSLWFNCAWVCSAAGIAHHVFWFLLWPKVPNSLLPFSGVITPILCATAVILLLVRCNLITTPAPQKADHGEPFDLGMIGFSLAASMLFVWTETMHSETAWFLISAERPNNLRLPPSAWTWMAFSSLLVFRLWSMYKRAVSNLPWHVLDKGLLTFAGLAMVTTGVQFLWLSPFLDMEVVLYGSTFILWGSLQAVLTWYSTRLNAATESRNAVAIVAIGLQIGTCLIPGNMFKLVQMDVSAAQALSYALNNALFTMGLYFGLNGFGVKVYFLKKLKRFRMKYLGFKN